MRTITTTTNLYRWDELSEEAKENAIENYRRDIDVLAWQDENRESVEAIAKALNCRLDVYSYDGIQMYVNFENIDDGDEVLEMKGVRAYKYIVNNYLSKLMTPKTYWKDKTIYFDSRKNWKRKSKINFGFNGCPFTGYYMDNCLYDGWKEWVVCFDKDSTVQDFIDFVANSCADNWTADNEYQLSDECITEMLSNGDFEFTEDGYMY